MPVGLLACAILLVNNLRDVETDKATGKRTLAVRVGAPQTVRLYRVAVFVSLAMVAVIALEAPMAMIALAAAALAAAPLKAAKVGAPTPVLVGSLIGTARLQIVLSVLLAAGIAWK